MRTQWTVVRSVGALTAGVLGFMESVNLVDMEAGGGRLAGPLIGLCLLGSTMLLACAAFPFTQRPAAAVTTMVAALLCCPLLIYRVAPYSLSWLSGVPSSVVPAHVLNFDPLAAGGMVAVLVVAATCVRALATAE